MSDLDRTQFVEDYTAHREDQVAAWRRSVAYQRFLGLAPSPTQATGMLDADPTVTTEGPTTDLQELADSLWPDWGGDEAWGSADFWRTNAYGVPEIDIGRFDEADRAPLVRDYRAEMFASRVEEVYVANRGQLPVEWIVQQDPDDLLLMGEGWEDTAQWVYRVNQYAEELDKYRKDREARIEERFLHLQHERDGAFSGFMRNLTNFFSGSWLFGGGLDQGNATDEQLVARAEAQIDAELLAELQPPSEEELAGLREDALEYARQLSDEWVESSYNALVHNLPEDMTTGRRALAGAEEDVGLREELQAAANRRLVDLTIEIENALNEPDPRYALAELDLAVVPDPSFLERATGALGTLLEAGGNVAGVGLKFWDMMAPDEASPLWWAEQAHQHQIEAAVAEIEAELGLPEGQRFRGVLTPDLQQQWAQMAEAEPGAYQDYMATAGNNEPLAFGLFAADAETASGIAEEQFIQFDEEIRRNDEAIIEKMEEENFTAGQAVLDILAAYGRNVPLRLATAFSVLIADQDHLDGSLVEQWGQLWERVEEHDFAPSSVFGLDNTMAGLALDLGAGIAFDPLTWIFAPRAAAGAMAGRVTTPAEAHNLVRLPRFQQRLRDAIRIARSPFSDPHATWLQLGWMSDTGHFGQALRVLGLRPKTMGGRAYLRIDERAKWIREVHLGDTSSSHGLHRLLDDVQIGPYSSTGTEASTAFGAASIDRYDAVSGFLDDFLIPPSYAEASPGWWVHDTTLPESLSTRDIATWLDPPHTPLTTDRFRPRGTTGPGGLRGPGRPPANVPTRWRQWIRPSQDPHESINALKTLFDGVTPQEIADYYKFVREPVSYTHLTLPTN